MSAASMNARPSTGTLTSNNKTNQLLNYMKLRDPSDPTVHEKISDWVATQKIPVQIHPTKIPTCRVSSALLLQRLVRAFENRQSPSSDDAKKANASNANDNRMNPASPTRISETKKAKRPLQSLSILMQRKVKVTQLVQQAVQFVGSDVLKVLQVSTPSPTVADVANACLGMLNNENRIKGFYRTFSDAIGKDPSTINEASSVYFGVFALQALQSLRAQAILSYEFSHDFEMIYRTCYQNQTFQICMHELNPAMRPLTGTSPTAVAPDTEARNICWKLARLLVLKYDYNNKSGPEAKDHRRNHILLSATSIILAANIGKAIKNGEVTTGSSSMEKGPIPDDIDFVSLVAVPVSDLLNFLAKNMTQNQGITPIRHADIRSHVMDICILINEIGIGQRVTNNVSSLSSNSMLAKAFSPAKLHILIHDYRNIIQTLVIETQKELKINTTVTTPGRANGANVRTSIANVLLFFPMVIGEPWGIHRDAPMITSKMLCIGENSKPPDPLKNSVAVVLKMKPRPQEIKRKAPADESSIHGSVRSDNKRSKASGSIESSENLPNKGSPGKSVSPVRAKIGEIEAPVVNDTAELNEWTLSILSLSVIKPTDTLLTYLGENDRMRSDGSSCLQDVLVPVLNRGVLRIQSVIRSSSNLGSEVLATKLSVGRRDGQVYVNGHVDKDIQLCASVVGFYYYSLEAIIHDQMERMDFFGSFSSQLQSESFHRALLACCYSCILKGVGRKQKLQMNRTNESTTIKDLMDTTESDPFTFLKVTEAFFRALISTKESTQKHFVSPIVAGLPVILYKHIQKVEAQLIDSVLWNTSSSSQMCFALSVKTMKSLPGAWPPDILEPMLPEEITDLEGDSSKSIGVRYKPSFGSSSEANFLSFVLRKLLKSIFFRIRAMCAALNMTNESCVHTQTLVAFRYLLRYHISVFDDRHVDQLLLCTLYGVCRVMKIKPTISFGKLIDAYFTIRGQDQGERVCRMIVRHVKLTTAGNEIQPASKASGNIVDFYNTIYVTKMQKYFLGSKSLKKSAELYLLNRNKGGLSEEKNDKTEKVSKASSNLTTDAVVGVQISPSNNVQSMQAVAGSPERISVRKNIVDTSLMIEKSPRSLESREKVSRTNELDPMVGKSSTIVKPKPVSGPSAMDNPPSATDNPPANGSKRSIPDSLQGANGTRTNGLSEEHDTNTLSGGLRPQTEDIDKPKSSVRNGEDVTERSIIKSKEKGLENIGGASSNEATASS